MIRTRPDPDAVRRVAEWLHEGRSVLFVTGAGISADSGIPTYRGIGGLYDGLTTEDGLAIEEALSGRTMARDPQLCWKYIAQIEAACRGATFNDGHRVLARLEQELDRVVVLTQNVDGFHVDAGSQAVIEIHGNLRHLVCTRCGFGWEVANYAALDIPPGCPRCGSLVRPQVVLFGEMLPQDAVMEYQRQLHEGFDLIVAIGTTALFPYIAQPVWEAKSRRVPTVEINPGTTALSGVVDVRIAAGAAEALTAIWDAYTSS